MFDDNSKSPSREGRISSVAVLGGGSAGLLAAITLKKRLPELKVTLLYDSSIPVIGVGEGTTKRVPIYLHGYLGIDPQEFHQAVRPSYKLGIRMLWGPRPRFHYTFTSQLDAGIDKLERPPGFYCDDNFDFADQAAALMAYDKGFTRERDGGIRLTRHLAYHLHNKTFVDYLRVYSRRVGVEMTDERFVMAALDERGISALQLASGSRLEADLYIDCSGFRAELIGRVLQEPLDCFQKSLFCDRALVGGWPRTDEELLPFTTAETMNAGWCWRIEHEDSVNRGYVYSSNFLSDEAAEREFRAKNPKVTGTRVVKFQSAARRRTWVKNVVALGNAAGFVEPLEATALTAICDHAGKLIHALVDSDLRLSPTTRKLYNEFTARQWHAIRRFLAIHYKYNQRVESEFWRACHADTDLAGAWELVEYYRECGPSRLWGTQALGLDDPFSWEGYLVMFVGMKVPHRAVRPLSEIQRQTWRDHLAELRRTAQQGVGMLESLHIIRTQRDWDLDLYRRASRW